MNIIQPIKYCLLALSLLCFCSSAYADFKFYLVNVDQVGPYEWNGNAVMVIQATDLGGGALFTKQYFTISETVGKTGLAAGLAGLSLSKPLLIRADLTGAGLIPGFRPIQAVLLAE